MTNVVISMIIGAITTLGIQELWRRRAKKTDAVSQALDRLKQSGGSISILPPKNLIALFEALEFLKVLSILKELKDAVGGIQPQQDIKDTIDDLESQLRTSLWHVNRDPDGENSRQSDDEMDRIIGLLPPRARPSFMVLTPPSPVDALDGIDKDGEESQPTTTTERTTTFSDGSTLTRTTTAAPDGTTKEVTVVRDPEGRRIEHEVILRDSNGFKTQILESDISGTWVREVWKDPGGVHESFCRPLGNQNEPWRNVDGSAPGRGTGSSLLMPLDEARSGAGPFMVRLKDGTYARCVFLNPVAGIGYCTILGHDEVNVDPENAPVLYGTDMIVDPEDLVINPSPDVDIPRDGTPHPFPHEVGPGPRPPSGSF